MVISVFTFQEVGHTPRKLCLSIRSYYSYTSIQYQYFHTRHSIFVLHICIHSVCFLSYCFSFMLCFILFFSRDHTFAPSFRCICLKKKKKKKQKQKAKNISRLFFRVLLIHTFFNFCFLIMYRLLSSFLVAWVNIVFGNGLSVRFVVLCRKCSILYRSTSDIVIISSLCFATLFLVAAVQRRARKSFLVCLYCGIFVMWQQSKRLLITRIFKQFWFLETVFEFDGYLLGRVRDIIIIIVAVVLHIRRGSPFFLFCKKKKKKKKKTIIVDMSSLF